MGGGLGTLNCDIGDAFDNEIGGVLGAECIGGGGGAPRLGLEAQFLVLGFSFIVEQFSDAVDIELCVLPNDDRF